MMTRSTISAVVGGMALGAGIAVAVFANAQDQGGQGMAAPASAPLARPLSPDLQQLHVEALAADTFVTVKDHGDAQTVSVFKLDQKGMNHLTHKAKFFY